MATVVATRLASLIPVDLFQIIVRQTVVADHTIGRNLGVIYSTIGHGVSNEVAELILLPMQHRFRGPLANHSIDVVIAALRAKGCSE